MEFRSSQNKQNLHNIFYKKNRAGQICPEQAETARIWPRSIHSARETPIQTAGKRGPAVNASGRPNRYAPSLAVRLSDDRRRSFGVSATETRASAGVRVWLGVIGAHLGRLGVDLAVAFGCGASEEVGDVIGEASVEAAWS
jgi:hypothetical protein